MKALQALTPPLLIQAASSVAEAIDFHSGSNITQPIRHKADERFLCRLTIADGWAPNEDGGTVRLEEHFCEEDDGVYIPVTLPSEFKSSHKKILPRRPVLRIPGGVVVSGRVAVPADANITIAQAPERHLAQRNFGSLRALAVRIVAGGVEPSESLEILQGRTMGAGGSYHQDINFRTQINQCSFNQLTIDIATSAHGTGIANGVVQVDATTAGVDMSNCDILGSCKDNIGYAIRQKLGLSLEEFRANFDFVVVCVPYGSSFGGGGRKDWAAFTYGDANNLMYAQSPWCGHQSSVQHEIGHLMNLGHSNWNGVTRNDMTGTMGAGSPAGETATAQCYNGAKYGQLGWMDDRTATLDPTKSHFVRLVGFIDKQNPNLAPSDRTLLKVGDKRLLYNRASGFNSGTRSFQNAVTIVQDQGHLSEFVAGLADNAALWYLNQDFNPYFNEATFDGVTFKVCGRGRDTEKELFFANVSVRPAGAPENCGTAYTIAGPASFLAPTVPAPTQPSAVAIESEPSPTAPAPVEPPTKEPTKAPTNAPTKGPTKIPTKTPTKAPTRSSASSPIESESVPTAPAPVQPPTRGPTDAPAKAPTKSPTKAPTMAPTRSPTRVPITPPVQAPVPAPVSLPVPLLVPATVQAAQMTSLNTVQTPPVVPVCVNKGNQVRLQDKYKTCAWAIEKTMCGIKDDFGVLISHTCRIECDMCPVYRLPVLKQTPTPTAPTVQANACTNEADQIRSKGKWRTCAWVQTKKQCFKKDDSGTLMSQICRVECGVCQGHFASNR